METTTDLIVVGAGVAGLSVALPAIDAGLSVRLFDRTSVPEGASVRNFGMFWPIGQPAGEQRDLAMRSRELWLERAERFGFMCGQCGSLHVVQHEDELAVIREYADSDANTTGAEVISPAEAAERSPAVIESAIIGALWSPTELVVDPRQAIRACYNALIDQARCGVHRDTHISHATANTVTTSEGKVYEAGAVVVCSGPELGALFPHVLRDASIVRCKLHMMRTRPQPEGWKIGPHLAGGLTLRHYDSFAGCPSLASVRSRVAEQTPEFDEFGIHVMAAQHLEGRVILGDSHEYAGDITPYENARINELILDYLRGWFDAPVMELDQTWAGYYAKRTDGKAYLLEQPAGGPWLFNGLGGNGMTLSPALGEKIVQRIAANTQTA